MEAWVKGFNVTEQDANSQLSFTLASFLFLNI